MPTKNTKTTEVVSNPALAPKATAAAVKPAVSKVAQPRAKATVSTHKTRTTSTAAPTEITTHQIADLAYFMWLDRGCPAGTPEEDWHKAESELRVKASVA